MLWMKFVFLGISFSRNMHELFLTIVYIGTVSREMPEASRAAVNPQQPAATSSSHLTSDKLSELEL